MSNDVQVRDLQAQPSQNAAPVAKPLREVLDAIRVDSLTDSQAFLDETVAKHGGE